MAVHRYEHPSRPRNAVDTYSSSSSDEEEDDDYGLNQPQTNSNAAGNAVGSSEFSQPNLPANDHIFDINNIDPSLLENFSSYPDPAQPIQQPYAQVLQLHTPASLNQHQQNFGVMPFGPIGQLPAPLVPHISLDKSTPFPQSVHGNFDGQSVPFGDVHRVKTAGIAEDFSAALPSFRGAQTKNSRKYQNAILNNFEDPAEALGEIDAALGVFPAELVGALNNALHPVARQKQDLNLDTSNNNLNTGMQVAQMQPSLQAAVLEPHTPGLGSYHSTLAPHLHHTEASRTDTSVTTHESTGTNNRSKKIEDASTEIKNFDVLPRNFLQPWSAPPKGQGGNGTTFDYSRDGELNPPGKRFEKCEIEDFLYCHPLHVQSKEDSGLTLWLQKVPADSSSFYPSKGKGDKCRWKDCPTKSLRTGEFRVTLSETHRQLGSDFNKNPFHNAGYIHLYCMERMFNIIDISKNFKFIPDGREHSKFYKSMAITRDGTGILETFGNYMKQTREDVEQGRALLKTSLSEWFLTTLTYKLTSWHVKNAKANVIAQARNRGGFNIMDHKGDLDAQVKYRKGRKRSIAVSYAEGDEESADEDAERRQKPAKKQKLARKSRGRSPSPDAYRHRSISTELSETSLAASRSLRSSSRTAAAESSATQSTSHQRHESNARGLSLPQNTTGAPRRSGRSPPHHFDPRVDRSIPQEAPRTIEYTPGHRSPTRRSPRAAARLRQQEEAVANAAPQAPVMDDPSSIIVDVPEGGWFNYLDQDNYSGQDFDFNNFEFPL